MGSFFFKVCNFLDNNCNYLMFYLKMEIKLFTFLIKNRLQVKRYGYKMIMTGF